MKIRSVSLDEKDLKKIEAIAKQKRTNVSALIRESIVEYIKKNSVTANQK